MLSEYKKRLDGLTESELANELASLKRLMAGVMQEYEDRKETLALIGSQMDQVRERLSDYEEAPF
jgi:hypothetical protein